MSSGPTIFTTVNNISQFISNLNIFKKLNPTNFLSLTATECNNKKREMNRRLSRMTETNQELDRIIIESFRHNQFPDQQKAVLKEIKMRKGKLK